MRLIILGALAGIAVLFFMVATRNSDESIIEQIDSPATSTDDRADANAAATAVAVTPISHASLVMEWGDVTVYADPTGERSAYPEAVPDIILLTDIHADHLSTSTIESLMGERTVLVVPQAVEDVLPAALADRSVVVGNGETTEQNGLEIQAVPMYNLPETDDSRHAKGRGNGYVISGGDTRVYIAGDTDGTPEMRALTDIDIAFVPMNPPYTMDVAEAADAVLAFAPARVYPYHYRTPDGLSDVAEFRRLVEAGNPAIEVVLLDWYPDEV